MIAVADDNHGVAVQHGRGSIAVLRDKWSNQLLPEDLSIERYRRQIHSLDLVLRKHVGDKNPRTIARRRARSVRILVMRVHELAFMHEPVPALFASLPIIREQSDLFRVVDGRRNEDLVADDTGVRSAKRIFLIAG
jgi:hypothetical protein